jgi:glucose-1-phosphate cytidylyltransferase
MREETEFRPKPMVEVGGRPVLWHIMKNLASSGISDFIIATGYRNEVINDYFLNYASRNNDFSVTLGSTRNLEIHGNNDESNWRVTLAYTGELTNTGGRVLSAAKYLDSGPFVVTYGDGLADVRMSDVLEHHQLLGGLVTLTAVQPTSRFGVLDIGDDGMVVRFDEKPTLEGWINIGFFVMEMEFLEYLNDDSVLEQEPLRAVAQQARLSAYRHTGFWQPMDTYREALMLNDLCKSGTPPWQVWR